MPAIRSRIRRRRSKKKSTVERRLIPTTAQTAQNAALHPMLSMQQTLGNQAMLRRVSQGTVQRANPPDGGGGQKTYEVTDSKALLRTEPPGLNKKSDLIPKGQHVVVDDAIQKGGKNYVKVSQHLPEMTMGPVLHYGWTWAGNLDGYTAPADIKTVEKKASAADLKAMDDDEIKAKIDELSWHPLIMTAWMLIAQAQAISDALKSDEKKNKKNEQTGDDRNTLVELIGGARSVVKQMNSTILMTDDESALGIRAYFYRQISKAVPFYTQMANANVLGKGDEGKKTAAYRTCNVTSIAMALEGLGKTADTFAGDQTLMDNILSVFEGRIKKSTKNIGAQDIDLSDASSLRLPDFLQLVAIYIKLTEDMKLSVADLNAMAKDKPGTFEKKVQKGRDKAVGMITQSKLFFKFTDLFGVQSVRIKSDHSNKLSAMGGTYRKKGEKHKLSKDEIAGMEKKLAVETYRNSVLNSVLPYINEGSQVVINLYNHYIRLQTLNEDEIVVDDPGGTGRDGRKYTWEEARAMGYFRVTFIVS